MNYDPAEAMKLKNQLCFPLYAAARKVTNLYTPHLKPLGLTYTQYILMLVLWEQDGITVGEICGKLMLDNGTVSPMLKKMEQEGLLKRKRGEEDERVVSVFLTDEGRALQEKAAGIPVSVGSCIDLEPQKAEMLYKLLYEILLGH
ncbi:MAG: MarR family transcriptional regulator [Lachnospiraceae bacterium]|nr:MarR family transcriptional regulator [Lachnospiraceae bacterium]